MKTIIKILSVILSALLLSAVFPVSAGAKALTYEGCSYRVVNNKYVELLRCTGISKKRINADGWYEIPSKINGLEVRYIGEKCFCYDSEVYRLGKVVIPDSVVCIENSAFRRPSAGNSLLIDTEKWLTDVKLSENLKYIGENAFEGCDFKELTIPPSVERIGRDAFYGCAKLFDIRAFGTVMTSFVKAKQG